MALAECNTTVDKTGQELVVHGTTAFPIACYNDDFRKMDVPWHWHPEWEAVLLTEGSCTVAAGNQKYVLSEGQGFFINSGILHGCWDLDATGCMFHSIVFHPRLVGGSLDSIFHQHFVQPLLEHPALEIVLLSPSVPWQSKALEAIEEAWQQCACEPAGYAFRTRSALSELVYLLHSNMPSVQRVSSGKSIRDGERIKTMLSFIHENYSNDMSTHRIAQSALISESECLRCFRTTIGTTPIQYVKQYRIQQAALLLCSTQKSVSEIASQCGFQDMSYFSKAFREVKGCVPTQYRQRNP